jgi:hypothetical protein
MVFSLENLENWGCLKKLPISKNSLFSALESPGFRIGCELL